MRRDREDVHSGGPARQPASGIVLHPSTPAANDRFVSLYTELAKTIRESGLMRRRYAFYWCEIVIAVAAFTGSIIIGYLNNVGLRARDPFDCPLAAQLRG